MHKLTDLDIRNEFTGYLPFPLLGKKRVNLLALGDVGGMLLTGLRLMGGDVIQSIGICDLNENMLMRYELEMNQIAYPRGAICLPEVEIINQEKLFDCDVFIFCASKAVPKVGEVIGDVRMVQFNENKKIVQHFASMAAEKGFKGLFAVVSDPVDPLCKAAYLGASGGLLAEQIKGFGLGVMNGRAMYYAKKEDKLKSFLTEGRVFGPHGGDLVVANSLENYNNEISEELTQLTINANLKIRELGYKPYIAPALSSGVISIVLALRGEWHYSSTFIGMKAEGAYMGALNRLTEKGVELEDFKLPKQLFQRIEKAYNNLKEII